MRLALVALALTGCLASPRPWTPPADPPVFAFAVVTDPHVGRGDGEANLRACVAWLNAHRESERIELVFVLGDLGRRLDVAQQILDDLEARCVPVIGDGAVEYGTEEEYLRRFGRPTTFVHRGVGFVGLDWISRDPDSPDEADLRPDTLAHLCETLERWSDAPPDSILLMTHHPMHAFAFGYGAFSPREMSAIEAVTSPHAARIHANFAGHYHLRWQEDLPRAGYLIYGTEAVEDGGMRVVRVHRAGSGFAYEHAFVSVQR